MSRSEPAAGAGACRRRGAFARRVRAAGSWLRPLSAVILWMLVLGYAGAWVSVNLGSLFDADLQNDDAQIHLMPAHRYDGKGTLKDDPVANDMLAFSTLGSRLLYRLLVPRAGVYAAAKVVQLAAYLVVAACVLTLALSRRGGAAAAALLLFFCLHTEFIVDRMAGGLQRGFAFPVLIMWLTGALTRRPKLRYGAALAGAATYPTSMALVLGAEGLFQLRRGAASWAEWGRRLGIYAAVAAVCLAVTRVDGATRPDAGRLPTYRQAAENPAFGRLGRTVQIPFRDPVRLVSTYLFSMHETQKEYKFCKASSDYRKLDAAGPLVTLALLVLLSFWRAAPPPRAAVALGAASILLYALARAFAFRLLYIPDRFIAYGMTACGLALAVSVLGRVGAGSRDLRLRGTCRNLTAAVAVILTLAFTGDHLKDNPGMAISRHKRAPLWDFIAALPAEARLAAHPIDADGIAYWTGRASTPGDEQLLPWLDRAWERNRALAERALAALYATNLSEVSAFAEREAISHFLVNRDRYGDDFRRMAKTFEPIGRYASRLTADRELTDLVFARLPEPAVLFRHREFALVETAAFLRTAASVSNPMPAPDSDDAGEVPTGP